MGSNFLPEASPSSGAPALKAEVNRGSSSAGRVPRVCVKSGLMFALLLALASRDCSCCWAPASGSSGSRLASVDIHE